MCMARHAFTRVRVLPVLRTHYHTRIIMDDQTFINAIQSRLNDGEGFYTHTNGSGETIALWTNDVQAFIEHGTVTDTWCLFSVLGGVTFDAALNYGDIAQYA